MDINELTKTISNSKSYRGVNPETIARVSEEALRKNPKYAINTAKNDLHRMWGAFYSSRPRFEKLLSKIKKSDSNQKEQILNLLKIHSSTAERIPLLNKFYKQIFEVTGMPETILDVACGFNPLTIPWMNLPASTKYIAYDIDVEEIEFLNDASKLINISPLPECRAGDVFITEFPESDCVFIFKLLPVVEQQRKGSSLEILKKFKTKNLVVSFPLKSLSGKEVGMKDFYTNQFEELVTNENWEYSKILFDNEVVYVIKRNYE